MSQEHLNKIKEVAIKAGQLALEKQNDVTKLNIQKKKDGSPVTAVDIECEELIKQELNKHFEGFSFLAEESGEENHMSNYRWIIDPIDGTSNFVKGMKSFACAICLQEKGKSIASVVYFPALDELYSACRDKTGAFLEFPKQPTREIIKLNATQKLELQDCLISYGISKKSFDQTAPIMKKLSLASSGIRSLGAASLDIIKVAKGEFGAYIKTSITEWDLHPAAYIAEKAGAGIYDIYAEEINTDTYNPKKDGCIIANTHVIAEIKEVTKPTMEKAGELAREVYEDKICPLAHKAVETSSPYVKEACQKSKPYVKSSVEFTKNTAQKAKPYCIKTYNATKSGCIKAWPYIVKAGVCAKNGTCKAVKFIKGKIKK